MWIAQVITGNTHHCEFRSSPPTDTDRFIGPFSPAEIYVRMRPHSPQLKLYRELPSVVPDKEVSFNARYDPESKTILLFDFAGYIATFLTPQTFWNAVLFEIKYGPGSLRLDHQARARTAYIMSIAERDRLEREVREFQDKKMKKAKAQNLTLKDLGLI